VYPSFKFFDITYQVPSIYIKAWQFSCFWVEESFLYHLTVEDCQSLFPIGFPCFQLCHQQFPGFSIFLLELPLARIFFYDDIICWFFLNLDWRSFFTLTMMKCTHNLAVSDQFCGTHGQKLSLTLCRFLTCVRVAVYKMASPCRWSTRWGKNLVVTQQWRLNCLTLFIKR